MSNGAKVIEKHFTIDNKLEGRDNKFAILPKELEQICNYEKEIQKMMIDHGLNIQRSEIDVYENYRGRFRKN